MMSMELALGAPVTDPQGKSARNSSTSPVPGRSRAVTSEVSWSTVSKRSTVNRAGTATLPVSATRATSFRRRSTIMTFSALLLGAVAQLPGQDLVLARVPPAPGGPLHRPEQDLVAAALEEQLRAGAGDGEASEVEVGVVGPALGQGEVPVEPERVAVHPAGHPDRQ